MFSLLDGGLILGSLNLFFLLILDGAEGREKKYAYSMKVEVKEIERRRSAANNARGTR